MKKLSDNEKIELFLHSGFLKDVPVGTLTDLAGITKEKRYQQGTLIARNGIFNDNVYIVVKGLLKVSACSETGKRITFLLVKRGETFNIMSPFIDGPRFLEAEAFRDTSCLVISGQNFREFLSSHPDFSLHLMYWIAPAIDSAFSRIFDLMEKNVEFRVMRTLLTLSAKFGSPLYFTNAELAEIAGTTTESTIRTMATLRKLDVIETERGKIRIKNPDALEEAGKEYMRL